MSIDDRRRRKSCPCHSLTKYNINKINSLQIINPELAKEWHPTLNGDKTPAKVFASSRTEKAWWQCKKIQGHAWETKISTRHHSDQGCPYCDGKKVDLDNCLVAKNPKLAAYWNYEKNGQLTPSNITVSSGKKAWWKCPSCNNEWEGFVNNMNRSKNICTCSKNKKAAQIL